MIEVGLLSLHFIGILPQLFFPEILLGLLSICLWAGVVLQFHYPPLLRQFIVGKS